MPSNIIKNNNHWISRQINDLSMSLGNEIVQRLELVGQQSEQDEWHFFQSITSKAWVDLTLYACSATNIEAIHLMKNSRLSNEIVRPKCGCSLERSTGFPRSMKVTLRLKGARRLDSQPRYQQMSSIGHDPISTVDGVADPFDFNSRVHVKRALFMENW